MPGYRFYTVRPELADVVEAVWHADIPNAAGARSIVLPVLSPILCFHRRAAPLMRLHATTSGDEWSDAGRYRMTGLASTAARLRTEGPVGGVMVRLKPESASHFVGLCTRDFCEAAFSLADVFSPVDISLLDEMLLEEDSADAHVAAVQTFLLARLREDRVVSVAARAAAKLRRNPALTVRDLAASLDVSDRHLARCFFAEFGTNPKQFARISRLAVAVRKARAGCGWAETATASGFADQAHMINEFRTMVGAPPDRLFRGTSLGSALNLGMTAAESEFYNTFVIETSIPVTRAVSIGAPNREISNAARRIA